VSPAGKGSKKGDGKGEGQWSRSRAGSPTGGAGSQGRSQGRSRRSLSRERSRSRSAPGGVAKGALDGKGGGKPLKRLRSPAMSPSHEEKEARQERDARQQRLARFERERVLAAAGAGGDAAGDAGEGVGEAAAAIAEVSSSGGKPVQGLCSDMERPYMRAPNASHVRPLPLLRKAFEFVQKRWNESQDWVYVGEQLRSIRQDITIQRVRTPFTTQVYEFNARAALVAGDFKQFEQCSAQLEDLYSDAKLSLSAHTHEFLACRLLYLQLLGDHLQANVFLKRHGLALKAAADEGHGQAAFAWRLRHLLARGSITKTIQCIQECPEARVLDPLVGPLLEMGRLRQLVALCKSCRPSLCRGTVLQILCRGADGQVDASAGGLPLVNCPDDDTLLDTVATAAAATGALADRRRIGEARTEHIQGFVRQPCPAPRTVDGQ